MTSQLNAGDIERLYYEGIAGTPMDNLRNATDQNRTPSDPNDALYWSFPLGATFSEVGSDGLKRIELTGNNFDNFGTLTRGYIQAPMDGAYRFYIASDDASELYISSDHTPLDLRAAGNFLSQTPAPIAFETGCCTALFSGDRIAERTSDPITLVKGKLYYFEAYQKEGGGGAWIEVGWERPDGVKEIIPARAVFPFIFPESANFSAAAGFTENPASQTVKEITPVTFSVKVVMQPPLTFQWRENGNPISGANLAYLTLPSVTLAMTGNRYSVTVNGQASADATLTVQADPTKPALVSAWSSGFPHGFVVAYSKPMDAATATTAGNYTMTGQTLTLSGLEMLSPTQVLLKVSDFTADPVTIKVNNVKDATAGGNVIAADSTVTVNSGIQGLVLANLFTGLTRGPDGTGASEAQRTRDLPNFPNQPSWIGAVNGLDVPQTSATFGPGGNVEDFQTFIRGYLTAPESGDYTLYIRSDDPSAFYLSTDENSANLPAIDNPTVYEDGCCQGLGTANGALDEVVTLQAGKIYAFEVYAAEYGGGDYLQVGWTTPSSSQVTVIPSDVLSTRLPTAQLTITQQPASQTILQNTPVTFSVAVTGSDPFALGYQWYRNGQAIAGATGSSYTIGNVQVADNGARFTVKAANRNGTYNQPLSSEATLTVSTDNLPPEVVKIVGSASYTKVSITFNEPVDPTTAQNAANYTVAGLQVTAAALSANGRAVTLTTSSQTPGTRYNVTINGVADIISANNKISNFQGNFLSWNVARGWLTFQYFANISGNPVANLINSPKFPNSPDATLLLNSFNTPNGYAEAYGARIWGWFYPPTTGDYRFFLRSDDASQLFLNPDGPAEVSALTGGQPIAEETGCCGSFMEPDTGDAATSAKTYHLTAGSRYYIEALLKEGTGGDWLQAAYRLEGDPTPAASLQPIPGAYLGTILDVDVNLQITQQPTDELGTVASAGVPFVVEDFNTTDGGFTVETVGDVPGPWVYDGVGAWQADQGNDACGTPNNSSLNSPVYTMTQGGALTLTFKHRYSFEPEYDGGQVRISVNAGAFTAVPPENFRENGYWDRNLIGNGILLGKRGFNGNSAGYASGEFITSVASLGTFKQGDTISVQFIGGWDECAIGTVPNWVVDSLRIDLLPMIIQDFSVNDGSFTVQNSGTPPANWGPWVYSAAKGEWSAAGSDPNCGGPFNSKLSSPAYVVPQSDEVTLNFTHRYSLEGDYYDGGQVWISVNGGAFTSVPAENFTANGYATGTIIGTGILKGERAFNGDSPGYATTNFITSSALLGTFNKNDTIVVQFVGAWDECWGPTQPSWVIKNVQLAFGKAAKASTFDVVATATLHGDPVQVTYQWQRNDGAGWVDILTANAASFRIFPTPADFNARFRVMVSAPGASVTSSEIKLVTTVPVTPPEISIAIVGGQIKVTYTGTLQSAPNVAGTYANVPNAVSPYTVTGTAPMTFFRSVK